MKASSKAGRWAQRYTVIVVPDGVERVRRFQLRGRVVQRALAVAALAAALALGGLVDWVRLRTDAVEVKALRAETTAHREHIERFQGQLEELESTLARLHEFERKVRVIANLPKAATEQTYGQGEPPGVGGGGEEEETREALPEAGSRDLAREADVAAEPGDGRGGAAPSSPEAADAPELLSEAGVVGHLRARARVLRDSFLLQEESLADLMAGLDGKSRQLAATPSIWPTEGWLTSRFGRRISPFTGRPQFHAGIDIATHFGTPIVAPARGRVTFTGRKGALGRSVVIDHGYGVTTSYGHLSKTEVRIGQTLERGEILGAVGSSGRSTGPHLHYAVTVRGKAADPLDYLFE